MAENPFENLESDDPSFALTIRERLPFSFILTKQTQNFQTANLEDNYSRTKLEDAVKGLVAMIPEPWIEKDEDWKKDIAKAKKKIKVDIRPSFAGIRMKKELCELKGIQMEKEVEITDYFQLLHAVFNKLNRLGMITRKQWTEAPTGMPPGENALPEGMNLQEYLASLEEEKEAEENGT